MAVDANDDALGGYEGAGMAIERDLDTESWSPTIGMTATCRTLV